MRIEIKGLKAVLIVLFDINGVAATERIPRGQSANEHDY